MKLEEIIIENEWGLEITVDSDFKLDDTNFVRILSYVLRKCKELGKQRLLLDLSAIERKVSPEKLLQTIPLTEKIMGMGMKIAVIKPDYVDDQTSINLESFSYQKRIYIEYFSDKLMGLEWLIHEA